MLAIFKRRHLRKVLDGTKTQTRRIHKYTLTIGKTYAVRDRWFSKAQGHILVTRKFRQQLGDISPEDVHKEGFSNLEEFKQEWIECYGPGSWNPNTVVTAYEYKLKETPKTNNFFAPPNNEESHSPRLFTDIPKIGKLLID